MEQQKNSRRVSGICENQKPIADEMEEGGYNRDWEQCKAKKKNVKTEYRGVKDNNGKTGRGRKTFKRWMKFWAIGQPPNQQLSWTLLLLTPHHRS
jgi:hypothetical protein